jgi:ERCC4-type nuclease
MKIVFDERETTLYNNCMSYITTQIPQLKTSITIEKRVLPIGDVLLYTNENVLLSIIERKTISDLFSSIKDGRYEEQSYRLSHNGECSLHNVIYIIEGNITTLRGPAEKKLLYSTITSLNYFKGFSVFRTQSCMDTAELLVHMSDKIDRKLQSGGVLPNNITNADSIAQVETSQNYCTVVKKVKKENVDKDFMKEQLYNNNSFKLGLEYYKNINTKMDGYIIEMEKIVNLFISNDDTLKKLGFSI